MTIGPNQEVLATKVARVVEGGDFLEILLFSSPVRYRLDKHQHDLRNRLEEAQREGRSVQVLVDWECQEVLDLL